MISFNKLYPQSVLKHSVDHFQGIRMKNYVFLKMHFFQNMFKKLISILQLCPQSVLKHSVDHSQGIGMKIYFYFLMHVFCQNMFKKVVSIHQFMSTISSKTFSGSFSRYWNENLFF